MTKPIAVFRNFANAPKKVSIFEAHSACHIYHLLQLWSHLWNFNTLLYARYLTFPFLPRCTGRIFHFLWAAGFGATHVCECTEGNLKCAAFRIWPQYIWRLNRVSWWP